MNILDCPIKFDKNSFFDLVSLSAGAAIARQLAMGEIVIGQSGWNVDIKNGRISFGDKSFDSGVLGTESESSHTWLWGWANKECGLPERAAAPARRASKTLKGVPEFANASFLLDELHNGHNIAMVCCGITDGNTCYYRCPYDGGALFVQISGLPDEIFAPLAPEVLARQYLQVIQSLYCDHRLLAAGMLWLNGHDFKESASRIEGGGITFDFEEAGGITRVANVSMMLTP